MNISSLAAKLSHVDGQTDGRAGRLDEADSRFSQFCRHH